MILEEETYKKFGYYPRDLASKSNKKILAACDGCGKVRELYRSAYCVLCRSCGRKGERNHFYGKTHTKEARKKISARHKGKIRSEDSRRRQSESIKGEKNHRWKGGRVKRICRECGKVFYVEQNVIKRGYGFFCSQSCRAKRERRHRAFPKHHTKPERIFEDICKKNNLPFKYTGDGSFWIHNINPDFVESNGKKIVVEVFGDYWHSPLLNYGLREDRTLIYRKRMLKKYGFKLIVFWETDLLREDAEAFVLKSLNRMNITDTK